MKFLIPTAIAAVLITSVAPMAAAQPREPNKQAQQAPAPKKAPAAPSSQQEPYGRWDKSWGARPSAPPKHWSKKNDWHRHVRACQQKYRSYNARTDTYRTSAGKSRLCTL